MRAALLATGLAACYGGPAAKPVGATPVAPAPAAPVFAALGRAHLVAALATNELAAYALEHDTLVELGRLRFAPPLADGDYPGDSTIAWIDREHVLVQAGDVFVVSASGVEKLAPPTDERFDGVPPPKSSDENLTRGHGGRPIARGGKVYWNHCTYGLPYDGFQCEAYARIQIWPKTAAQYVEESDAATTDHGGGWREAPAGFALGKSDKDVPTCKAGGADVVLARPLRGDDDAGDDALAGGTHWLPASPPALLVEYGGFGLDFYTSSFAVFDRCSATPVIVGASYELFRDGLWAAQGFAKSDETPGSTLRRGLAVIGELPPNRGIALRAH